MFVWDWSSKDVFGAYLLPAQFAGELISAVSVGGVGCGGCARGSGGGPRPEPRPPPPALK